jgi:hypothetical protein
MWHFERKRLCISVVICTSLVNVVTVLCALVVISLFVPTSVLCPFSMKHYATSQVTVLQMLQTKETVFEVASCN